MNKHFMVEDDELAQWSIENSFKKKHPKLWHHLDMSLCFISGLLVLGFIIAFWMWIQ